MNIDHKQTSAVMSQCNSFSPLAILASVWKKMVSHTGCPKKIKMCVFRENNIYREGISLLKKKEKKREQHRVLSTSTCELL